MKAKIKPLIILIAIFAVSLIAFAAGCSIGEKNALDNANGRGLVCPVTYYANGGSFVVGTSVDSKSYRTVYYKPDAPVFNIGVDKADVQNLTVSRDGYIFTGWEYCKVNSEGLPVLKDDNGETLEVLENGTADIKGSDGRQLLEQSKRFTAEGNGVKAFENGRITAKEGEHIYLAATWVQDSVLDYILVTDTPITASETGEAGTTYQTDDVIASDGFGAFSEISLDVRNAPKEFENHSFIHLYWDKECTRPVSLNSTISKPTDGTNAKIYAKYLSGEWETVKDGSGFARVLSGSLIEGNIYIPYDIDCSSAVLTLKSDGVFNARVEGNGFKITGISIGKSVDQRLTNGLTYSFFGSLGANAEIKDLTIESVTANVSVRQNSNVTVYAMFSAVDDGAKIENFKVQSYSLSIDLATGASILNIPDTGAETYTTDNWLYGTTNDGQFVGKYGNVVQNATLKIGDKQVIGGQQ